MEKEDVENVIIIGSGPAGLSAAIYTSREGFNPLVISGAAAGGQLELTTVVENYPGFPEGVDGPALMEKIMKQAERFGTRFVGDDVSSVDFSARPFKITVGEDTYKAKCVIIATGAKAKTLGIPSEAKFMGRGISTCATCDGAFYRGKNVIVVGGGDTAMEDSLFLTRFANSVTIVHRRDAFKASKVMAERVLTNSKIKVMWNTTIEDVIGDALVTGARLKNTQDGSTNEVMIDGVFMAIGYEPNSKIFSGQLMLDEQGYIITKKDVETDIEGVFVAGDVTDRFYRQAATASGSGVKAALKVREYLSELGYEENKKEKTSV